MGQGWGGWGDPGGRLGREFREAGGTSANSQGCCQCLGGGEMSHGPELEQTWLLHLPGPGQACGSVSLVLPHWAIQCQPPRPAGRSSASRTNTNLLWLSTQKPCSLLEITFCNPGASLKSQVSILYPSGYQSYSSNCTVTCWRRLAELFVIGELILLQWNCFTSLWRFHGSFASDIKLEDIAIQYYQKTRVPLNEALGCDLESTFCTVFLCSAYVNIFKRSCWNEMFLSIWN